MTPSEILALPMEGNDADAKTVGGYLVALLQALWRKNEDFSGKRPFGNSGWDYCLRRAVIAGGASTGTIDEEGDVTDYGDSEEVVECAIIGLFPAEDRGTSLAYSIAARVLREQADRFDQSGKEEN